MSTTNDRSRRNFIAKITCQATIVGMSTSRLCTAEDTQVAKDSVDPSGPSDEASRIIPIDGNIATAISVGANDHIFVAVDRSVLVLDREGNSVERLEFDRVPRGLAIDSVGTLYVALAKSIVVIDNQTRERKNWSVPFDNAWLSGIAILGRDVFVADSRSGIVWRFDGTGVVTGEVASKAGRFSDANEFFSLSASAGRLHIANPRRHQVESFDINAQPLATWGGASRQLSGFSGCCNPMAVAVRQDGCVVTAERGIPRVKLFSSMGEFQALIAGPEKFSSISRRETDNVAESCSSSSFAVAVDSLHRTLVLDQAAREIRIFG
jgi:hypothetical protein